MCEDRRVWKAVEEKNVQKNSDIRRGTRSGVRYHKNNQNPNRIVPNRGLGGGIFAAGFGLRQGRNPRIVTRAQAESHPNA